MISAGTPQGRMASRDGSVRYRTNDANASERIPSRNWLVLTSIAGCLSIAPEWVSI
jgi:hypothetical protein